MSVYYTNCDALIPDHFCSSCDELELAKVRSVAFIKKSFSFIDPTDANEWLNGIASKDIIVIADTNGNYDGGAPVEGAGFGDSISTFTTKDHLLLFRDPNYKENCDFYNAIQSSRNYKLAFRTSSQTHLVEVPVTVLPKNPVADDDNAYVVWEVEVKWRDKNAPCPYDTPDGVFECFNLNP